MKKFNRKLLGDTGIEKVARAKSEQGFVQPDRKVGHLPPQGSERAARL